MIKIGDLAKICNVSTQTLRYYDAEDILKPDIIDSSSGYRFYSVDAVEKYKKILFYKSICFSLDEIKKIQVATSEELREILKKKKLTYQNLLTNSRNRLKRLMVSVKEIKNCRSYRRYFCSPLKTIQL